MSSLGIRIAQLCVLHRHCAASSKMHEGTYTASSDTLMQKNSRKVGPEVQSALAKQQAEHTEDLALLQEQLDGLKKTLNQQKAAAHAMVQVRAQS